MYIILNIYAYFAYMYYSKSIAIKVNNKNPICFNVRRITTQLNETLLLYSIQCSLYWKHFHFF